MKTFYRKILLGGILLVVSVSLGVVFFHQQFSPNVPQSPSLENGRDAIPQEAVDRVLVTITDEGFSPRGIHIKRGGVVTWVNATSRDSWPASNIHPTHEISPEFDPRRPIGHGEDWSFTFDKEGLWFYHDHLDPQRLGTIRVGE
jgi:plastocyanin